jgi:hypothetical protein
MNRNEVDPIQAVLSAHLAAISIFKEEIAKGAMLHRMDIAADDLDSLWTRMVFQEDQLVVVQTAVQGCLVARDLVIATAPTTRTGLRALEWHLRNIRPIVGCWNISRVDGGPGTIDWLISKRAAEIGVNV